MKLFDILEDIIFPPTCLFCGISLGIGTRPLICSECETKYGTSLGKCLRCNSDLEITETEFHCNTCRSAKHPFDGVSSAYFYEEKVRQAIVAHKFNFMYNHAKHLALKISNYILDLFPAAPDYIVPVPTSKKRLHDRGYDPLLEIAEVVSKNTGIPLNNKVLIKIKDTPHQSSTTSRLQRFRNVRGAFKVNDKECFRDKDIILFDDVYTTGASTYECAKILKKAGAKHIIIATVAISDYFRR